MNWEGIEKRHFDRGDFPCKVFIHHPDGHIISTYTHNISRGGIKVCLEEEIKTASVVNIEIYFDEEPLICKGRISWVRKKDNPDKQGGFLFDAGIECYKE